MKKGIDDSNSQQGVQPNGLPYSEKALGETTFKEYLKIRPAVLSHLLSLGEVGLGGILRVLPGMEVPADIPEIPEAAELRQNIGPEMPELTQLLRGQSKHPQKEIRKAIAEFLNHPKYFQDNDAALKNFKASRERIIQFVLKNLAALTRDFQAPAPVDLAAKTSQWQNAAAEFPEIVNRAPNDLAEVVDVLKSQLHGASTPLHRCENRLAILALTLHPVIAFWHSHHRDLMFPHHRKTIKELTRRSSYQLAIGMDPALVLNQYIEAKVQLYRETRGGGVVERPEVLKMRGLPTTAPSAQQDPGRIASSNEPSPSKKGTSDSLPSLDYVGALPEIQRAGSPLQGIAAGRQLQHFLSTRALDREFYRELERAVTPPRFKKPYIRIGELIPALELATYYETLAALYLKKRDFILSVPEIKLTVADGMALDFLNPPEEQLDWIQQNAPELALFNPEVKDPIVTFTVFKYDHLTASSYLIALLTTLKVFLKSSKSPAILEWDRVFGDIIDGITYLGKLGASAPHMDKLAWQQLTQTYLKARPAVLAHLATSKKIVPHLIGSLPQLAPKPAALRYLELSQPGVKKIPEMLRLLEGQQTMNRKLHARSMDLLRSLPIPMLSDANFAARMEHVAQTISKFISENFAELLANYQEPSPVDFDKKAKLWKDVRNFPEANFPAAQILTEKMEENIKEWWYRSDLNAPVVMVRSLRMVGDGMRMHWILSGEKAQKLRQSIQNPGFFKKLLGNKDTEFEYAGRKIALNPETLRDIREIDPIELIPDQLSTLAELWCPMMLFWAASGAAKQLHDDFRGRVGCRARNLILLGANPDWVFANMVDELLQFYKQHRQEIIAAAPKIPGEN